MSLDELLGSFAWKFYLVVLLDSFVIIDLRTREQWLKQKKGVVLIRVLNLIEYVLTIN